MKPVPRTLPDLIYYRLGKPQLNSRLTINQPCKVNLIRSKSNLLLGLISALLALPIITLIVMSSAFVSQQKWEEFWDLFLEET